MLSPNKLLPGVRKCIGILKCRSRDEIESGEDNPGVELDGELLGHFKKHRTGKDRGGQDWMGPQLNM